LLSLPPVAAEKKKGRNTRTSGKEDKKEEKQQGSGKSKGKKEVKER
jgi:hypothetical protein